MFEVYGIKDKFLGESNGLPSALSNLIALQEDLLTILLL